MTTPQGIGHFSPDMRELDVAPRTGEREVSAFVQPDVALHQSKGSTARRQLARQVLRIVRLASGDAAAAAAAAVLVGVAVDWSSRWIGHGDVPYPGVAEICVAMLIALGLSGNYQRSNPPHPTLHLLMGSALGAIVVCWSHIWVTPTLGAIPVAATLALVTATSLFLMRGALGAVAKWALPDTQRLVPAIVVSPDATLRATFDASSGYRVSGTVVMDGRHAESRAQELARAIRRERAESLIVLGDVRNAAFSRVLEIGLRAGCEVLCTPPGFGVVGVRPSLAWRGPYRFLEIGTPSLKGPQFIAKRCVDVLGSCVALLASAPLCAAIAVAIRLDSPGPILFRQERVGLGGRRFRMVKFRTMRIGADEEKHTVAHLNLTGDRRLFKVPNDPRISRVGGFLRRWSLDELPQFLNVIAGQMSLVGPRPFFEADFAEYQEHHFRRLGAKPGITGLWQIYGRSSVLDFEEVVRMDTQYIDEWSLWLDLKILAGTVPAVLRRTGAY